MVTESGFNLGCGVELGFMLVFTMMQAKLLAYLSCWVTIKLFDMAYDKALKMLHKNRVVLVKIVDELLDLEGLSGKVCVFLILYQVQLCVACLLTLHCLHMFLSFHLLFGLHFLFFLSSHLLQEERVIDIFINFVYSMKLVRLGNNNGKKCRSPRSRAIQSFKSAQGDDIRTKGKEIVQPKFEAFKERFNPLRNWAENTSKRWRVEIDHDVKEKPIIKELSKNLGARS